MLWLFSHRCHDKLLVSALNSPNLIMFLKRRFLHKSPTKFQTILFSFVSFEKETAHGLYVFIKIAVNSTKCETTARAHDAFCPLTQG